MMMTDEEKKARLLHFDDMRRKTLRALLEERLAEALRAIDYQTAQAKKEDSFWTRKEEEEWLLRVYTQLLATEEEASQLISTQQGQAEFWALVRAAAAARALIEKIEIERAKGGGFAGGVADALAQRNARARERLRNDESGDSGGAAAAAVLAPSPPKSRFLQDYEESMAAQRAMRAAAKKPAQRTIDEQKDDDVGLRP